jgi:hypothetical protein
VHQPQFHSNSIVKKLFHDDYCLNILAYCQEYLIYHDYWSSHLVPHLEQGHKVGHMNSHNQIHVIIVTMFFTFGAAQNSLIHL